MTTNRSNEELAMRGLIEAWGRARWPNARLVHELVTGPCRVDMAFLSPDHIAVVEIKSSRDTLARWDAQCKTFRDTFPEVWLAAAPKWKDEARLAPWNVGLIICDAGAGTISHPGYEHCATINRRVTTPMLELLWASEARSIAYRMRISIGKREPLHKVIPLLARQLTGDEIVRETCRELRGRSAFPIVPASDAPIMEVA